MRWIIRRIEWEYPAERQLPPAEAIDLHDKAAVMEIYMALANGTFHEMRVEADCQESLDVARGMIGGAGGASPHELTEEEKARVWLVQKGDQVYRQAEDGYIFLALGPRA